MPCLGLIISASRVCSSTTCCLMSLSNLRMVRVVGLHTSDRSHQSPPTSYLPQRVFEMCAKACNQRSMSESISRTCRERNSITFNLQDCNLTFPLVSEPLTTRPTCTAVHLRLEAIFVGLHFSYMCLHVFSGGRFKNETTPTLTLSCHHPFFEVSYMHVYLHVRARVGRESGINQTDCSIGNNRYCYGAALHKL